MLFKILYIKDYIIKIWELLNQLIKKRNHIYNFMVSNNLNF